MMKSTKNRIVAIVLLQEMLIKVGWHIKSCSDSAAPLLNYVKIYDKVGIYQHLKRRKIPKKNDEYNEKRKDLPRRSRYYQGQIDLAYLEKGSGYDELKDSFIIFICRFDPFGHGFSRYTVKSAMNSGIFSTMSTAVPRGECLRKNWTRQ